MWWGIATATALLAVAAVLFPFGSSAPSKGSTTTTHTPRSVHPSAVQVSPVSAPSDPRALVAGLALARRAHIVDGAADTATLPGSPAADADARLADAYAGRTVTGWSTQVASAEVVANDPASGTSVIRARISEAECSVVEASGEVHTVPAVPDHEVLLALQMRDGRWLITSVESA